jgi:catechol-2,3-dioxygenase
MIIDKLQLLAASPETLQTFYCETLGLPGPSAGFIQIGATRLGFLPAPQAWQGIYHFAFNIPPNLFDKACLWLSRRTSLLQDAQGETAFDFELPWNARAVYFHDPAGNILELVARRSLPESPPPFESAKLLSISEVGLAVEDVPRIVHRLEQSAGLEVFSGQGSDEFTAVGDDNGMFIVVQQGRRWYPQRSISASPLPLWVDFHTADDLAYSLDGPPYKIVGR